MSSVRHSVRPSVVLHGVAFAYAGSPAVFDAVDLHLERGMAALVGANGSGKSTLLALIAGELTPDEGDVRVDPATALIVSCPQVVEEASAVVHGFALRQDREARALRQRLRLAPTELERWPSLSEGERKRWQVGAALAQDPDVLLLDEPTNHLDEAARALLADALRRFPGIGVIVSHDRAFLDASTSRTLWLEDGVIRSYEGGYEDADAARRLERKTHLADRELAKKKRRRSGEELEARRRKRAAAQRNVTARGRIKGSRDSDGRSVNRRARAAKAEGALARGVRSLATRHARSERELAETRVDKALGAELFVHFEPSRRARLGTVTRPSLEIDGHTLIRPLSCTVERHSRIRITGKNGAGKSTLLRALLTELPTDTLYLPQELDAGARRRALAELRALPRDARGRALRIVAALGCDPRRLLDTRLPSPGEAKKLTIARGLGRGAPCVVLDEPTNHLDLPSINRLEAALAAYPGALVLVTHDAWFGERLSRETWRIEDGTLEIGLGSQKSV